MRKMAESCSVQRAPAQAQLLLVDDDVALAELVSEYAAYEGYAVTTANTGELGLRMVGRKAFALVAGALNPDAEELARISAETVVNGMINKGDALLVSRNVVISKKGVETLYSGTGSARRLASLKGFLSGLRISALNVQLRKRYKSFWGEAA